MTELTAGLQWDTEFFGFPIGRISPHVDDFAAAAAEADAAGYRCTYLLVEGSRSARLIDAQRAGFVTVATRVELRLEQFPLGRLHVDHQNGRTRSAERGADLDWVHELARTRFEMSRFYTDPGFGPDRAGRLFEAWVDRGLADPLRHVIVLDDAAGFVICSLDRASREGVIELIATAAERRGGGQVLLTAAHSWFHDQDLQTASVITQYENIAAVRLYEQAGYRMCGFGYWLHRWAPGAAGKS